MPSPKPKKILEAKVIEEISRKAIVIAAGGGGIPVYKAGISLKGVDAVIDKDLASACLAKSMKADVLLILTDVPCAYANYGTAGQKPLAKISVREAKHLIAENHFAQGSMLPKIEAAISFAESGGTAVITNIANAKRAVKGKAGTIVRK